MKLEEGKVMETLDKEQIMNESGEVLTPGGWHYPLPKKPIKDWTQEEINHAVEEGQNNFFAHDIRILLTMISLLRRVSRDHELPIGMVADLDYMDRKLTRLMNRMPSDLIAYGGRGTRDTGTGEGR
ncbi:MAG TPA: hypothetical protein VIY48_05930 [Candidatus Paceibacterota bacterium]